MTGRDGGTLTDNGPLPPVVGSVSEPLGKVKGEIPRDDSSVVYEKVFTVAMFKIRSYYIPSWWSTGR